MFQRQNSDQSYNLIWRIRNVAPRPRPYKPSMTAPHKRARQSSCSSAICSVLSVSGFWIARAFPRAIRQPIDRACPDESIQESSPLAWSIRHRANKQPRDTPASTGFRILQHKAKLRCHSASVGVVDTSPTHEFLDRVRTRLMPIRQGAANEHPTEVFSRPVAQPDLIKAAKNDEVRAASRSISQCSPENNEHFHQST